MRDIEKIESDAKALADRLTSELAVSFDNDRASQLALLQIMPFEEDAVPWAICDDVLSRDAYHPLATLVRAYLARHYLMDAVNLQDSANRLEHLIAEGTEVAAAALLLSNIHDDLVPGSRLSDTAHLVQVSIDAEPQWTRNHQMMAWVWREQGQLTRARAEFDLAIAYRIPPEVELSPLEWAYAAAFTGQVTNPGHLESARDELGR